MEVHLLSQPPVYALELQVLFQCVLEVDDGTGAFPEAVECLPGQHKHPTHELLQ